MPATNAIAPMRMTVIRSRVMVFAANRHAASLQSSSAFILFLGFPNEILVERSSQTRTILFRRQSASGGRSRFAGRVWHGFGHCTTSLLAWLFFLVGRSGIEPAPPSGHEWWRTCCTALDPGRRLESGRAIRLPFSHIRSQYCSPSSIGGTATRSVRSRTEPDFVGWRDSNSATFRPNTSGALFR